MTEISDLIGKTMKAVRKVDNDELRFETTNGRTFRFYHQQDCCERVEINDICGDLEDLLGSPLVQADEETSEKTPADVKHEYEPDSQTWTFYKFATNKGSVTIRWIGTSNGYYSERVSFCEMDV